MGNVGGFFFFFQAEDGIRDSSVTGVQTCALPICFDLGGFALSDEVAAGVAGAGPQIDNEIGAANGVFIVLDDEDGVAEIAQLFERAEKTSVVTGMEADAGLVENIENAAEARADLRSEAHAVGFAAA